MATEDNEDRTDCSWAKSEFGLPDRFILFDRLKSILLPGAVRRNFLLLPLALFGLNGCVGKLVSNAAETFIEDVSRAAAQHDDLDLIADASPTFLLLLEGLLERNPNDQELLTLAAQGYTSYAILVESQDLPRARRLYHRAKTYGLRALAQDDKMGSLIKAPYEEFRHITDELKDNDIEMIFWAASSWGAWISANTESMQALSELPKVILLMEWIVQQDETFEYGSPHIFLGVYHAALPPMLGGKPDQALFHFDRALEISQEQALMAYVLKAQYYARQIFDRELYVSLLERALEKPANQNPELTLQNIAAQRLARKLLAETEDFF